MKKFINIKRILSFMMALVMLACLTSACKEDTGITTNKIGQKPGPVSNIQVTPISGGAIIKYTLPATEDLRYIKATYVLDNGIRREAKSSIYKNEILVDGFGLEGQYNIELRSVSVGEVESDPIEVKVDVLTPPHQVVLERMAEVGNIVVAFGGFNVDYLNETKANIIIRVIKKDLDGKWVSVQSEYTNYKEGVIRIRGQKAEPTDFGIYIEDRWDHFSGTLEVNLTPIEEVNIPTNKFKRLALTGDAGVRSGSTFSFEGIWDGNANKGYLSTNSGVTPAEENTASITIDMGVPALLSRMKIWATRYSNLSDCYGPAHIYDFEVYGSNNPNPSGEYDSSWTKLDRFVSNRPSGFGFGVPANSEEQTELSKGETYEFSDPVAHEKFRYIRFKVFAGWNGVYEGSPTFFMYELQLFGQL